MVKTEKVRLVNPQKRGARRKSGSPKRRKSNARKNPAELLTLGFLANPQRGNMKKKATRKRARGARKAPHRRRKNPFGGSHHRKTHRRRNPSASLSGTTSILKSGFYALIGLVVSRQLPQMFLGARNAGVIGYAANLAAAIAASFLGSKFLGAEAGKAIAIGGTLYLANRVIQDNFSPVGKVLSISGMGDYTALGDIRPGYFPLPVPTNAAGQPIIPTELRPLPAPAAAGKGMGSVASSSRFNSRF